MKTFETADLHELVDGGSTAEVKFYRTDVSLQLHERVSILDREGVVVGIERGNQWEEFPRRRYSIAWLAGSST